jgi:FkbM family methyltransferase
MNPVRQDRIEPRPEIFSHEGKIEMPDIRRIVHYAIKGFKFRTGILFHWLKGRRNNVGFAELIRFLFKRAYYQRASDMVKEVDNQGPLKRVMIGDYKEPLYYPGNFDILPLYQVINETFSPLHWHYYEKEGTVIESDDIVADCGAAEGLFGFVAAHKCRKVYLIEPLPDFVTSLKKTFQKFRNVTICPFGLSSREEKGYLSDNDISSAITGQSGGIPVKMTTLDKLFHDRGRPVTYIKADLEGFELKMLEGGLKTIKKYKPKIAITTYHVADHASHITALLKKIEPRYNIRTKGIENRFGAPVMLHAWVDKK